jgi:threonine dehydratase
MVPDHRRKAIESLGAKVEIVGKNSDEADLYAREYSKKNNISLIHPFDDPMVIAGQGTIGLEMLESLPEVDTVIIPTSGGGLIGGIALAIKLQKPDVKIIAASMKRGPSMYESLKAGKPVDVDEEETLADCLGGSIGLDNKYTFKIAQDTIDDFVLIDEDKIAEGIKLNFEKHKIVTEGAAATGVMVVKDNLSPHLGQNIISLICGGNIDSELFGKIVI